MAKDLFSDNQESLQSKMLEHLGLKECELENGEMVTNLDGICDMLIGKALNGDLQVVQLIDQITKKSKTIIFFNHIFRNV